ncbi:MAG TPA: hypothetical protein VNG13_08425 [Mycobacteriales bacterium]|nr:hypothetical protein [Mycobacteriales bacterium]
MHARRRNVALFGTISLLAMLALALPAEAAPTPRKVAASSPISVTSNGSSASYSATLGPFEPDPNGPPAPVCGGDSAGCDQQPVTLNGGGFTTPTYTFTLAVTPQYTPSDPTSANCLDIAIEGPTGNVLASHTCLASGTTVAATNLAPGATYTIETDADNATALPSTAQSFTSTVAATATVLPISSQSSTASADLPTFSHEVTVDPQHADGEPDLAISSDGQDMYSGAPYGFSTTVSLMWKSSDGGVQWKNLHGSTIGEACPNPAAAVLRPDCSRGGGDAEVQLSTPGVAGGPQRVQFEDLNGLDTISCSYSDNGGDTFNDLGSGNVSGQACNMTTSGNTAAVTNPPGTDRQWLAVWPKADQPTGASADQLYMVYDTGETPPGGDAALTSPDNGATWSTACTTTTGSSCIGGSSAVGSRPGPLVINPTLVNTIGGKSYPTLYEFMGTNSNGTEVNISCDGGHTWSNIPTSSKLVGSTTNDFVAGAIDANGEVYTVFSVANDPNPWRLWFAHSTDTAGTRLGNCSVPVPGGTWSPATPLNGPASSGDGVGATPIPGVNYAVMPWIAAGAGGRVDVVYYGTTAGLPYSPDTTPALWYLHMAQSLDGGTTWTDTQASETPMHKESICFSGIGCTAQTPPGGDRNLLDFFQVRMDPTGRAVIQYVDDNNSAACAASCTQGAGLISNVQQATGPSLRGGDVPAPTSGLSQSLDVRQVGTSAASCTGPPCAVVTNPAGNAIVATAGHNLTGTPDPAADITQLQALTDPNNTGVLKFLFTVKDLSGGPGSAVIAPHTGANWLVTWHWNNDLWYAQATSDPTGGMSYSAGRPLSIYNDGEPKALEYTTAANSEATAVTGTVDTANNTIEIDVPVADVGGVGTGSDTTNHILYGLTGWTGNADAALPGTVCSASSTTTNAATCDGSIGFFDNVDQTAPIDLSVVALQLGITPEAPMVALLAGLGLLTLIGAGYYTNRRRTRAGAHLA